MSIFVYGFKDVKSGVVSNSFTTTEPWEKVKQNISISLLQLSLKEPTSPFVLYAADYELVLLAELDDVVGEPYLNYLVNCSNLLAASRKAFNAGKDQTSPDDQLDEIKE